jgi:tetratricopeptide (TPR) repeat protein
MAYAWYINNNMQKANYCLAQCKTQGEARIDGDKQAARFAEKGIWPQRTLLQARLLIDGGYNDKALQVLNSINVAALTDPGDRAEYYFRMGRVYEELAESASRYYKMALDNYRTAINIGKERHEQFAARAALHMGKVYEKLGLAKEALAMYNECLDMPSHDFQNSIDQQAKAGISL